MNKLTRSALNELKEQFRLDEASKIKFQIPVISGETISVTKRKSRIIRLLNSAIDRDLHEQTIVSAITVTEDYLVGIIKLLLGWFPGKLKLSISGNQGDKTVSLDEIIGSPDKKTLLSKIIQKRLTDIFYASPHDYFKYLNAFLSISIPLDLVKQYIEIKATRDLMIHNDGKVDSTYLRKVGDQARTVEAEVIPLDDTYVEEYIRCMKRLVVKIYKQCLNKYGDFDLNAALDEPV